MSYARCQCAPVTLITVSRVNAALLQNGLRRNERWFQMVCPHEWCEVSECTRGLKGPYLTKWNDGDDDLKSMSVLPYGLSSVCKLWYDLMLLVLHFWTRLVIFVNTQPTNIADLRTRLSPFRSFVFRLHIFNRQDVIHQEIAEARVQAVVNDLSPHSHRCEQFTFDVMHNSSLPATNSYFSGS